MSNTAPSRADPVVVFPLGRWCPPQETSQPHPPPPRLIRRVKKCKCQKKKKENVPWYVCMSYMIVNKQDEPVKQYMKHLSNRDVLILHITLPLTVPTLHTQNIPGEGNSILSINSSPPNKMDEMISPMIFSLRRIFMNEKFCILIKISLKFVPKGPTELVHKSQNAPVPNPTMLSSEQQCTEKNKEIYFHNW